MWLQQFFFLISGNFKVKEDKTLTCEIEKEIGPESPLQSRIKAIKELSDAVLNNHWEDVSLF